MELQRMGIWGTVITEDILTGESSLWEFRNGTEPKDFSEWPGSIKTACSSVPASSYIPEMPINRSFKKIFSDKEPLVKTIEIASLGSENLELIRNIPVSLEIYDDEAIAEFVDVEAKGFGETESEALENLKNNLISLYCEIKEDEANLGPLPKKWLIVLKELIKEK